jgi:hypothetical protein
MAVSGPAGSGKTFTLLRLATELACGGRIAYVDTEHGSASKYAHTPTCAPGCADPTHFSFDVIEPATFDPRDLIEAMDAAIKGGYAVFCVDSLSHYWVGPNGELELVDNAARQMRNPNSFAAWKTITPIHNQLVDKMLSASVHVLVAMRTKTEWVIDRDEKTGKTTPRKIGLQPVMRDGIEYEFDVCGDLDQDNTLVVTKSRCPELSGKSINRPGRDVAEKLKAWLGSGPADRVPSAVNVQENTNKPTYGHGQIKSVASSENAPPTPADGKLPEEMKPLIEGLTKPGGTRAALQTMRDKLFMLPDGDVLYRRILQDNGIVPGHGSAKESVKKALMTMWATIAIPPPASTYQATDEDVPDIFNTAATEEEPLDAA